MHERRRTGPSTRLAWGAAALAALCAACASGSTAERRTPPSQPTARATPPATTAPPTASSSTTPTTTTPPTTTSTTSTTSTTTTTTTSTTTTTTAPEPAQPAAMAAPAVVVEAADAAALSIAASAALFTSSPGAVVAAPEHAAAGTSTAGALAVPLLLAADPPAVVAEIDRLGAGWVVLAGAVPPAVLDGLDAGVVVHRDATAVAPGGRPAAPSGVVALVRSGDAAAEAATATARAAGIPVVAVDGGDPRLAPDGGEALRRLAPSHVVAIGSTGTFPGPEVLHGLVRTALAGHQLPGGGQVLFPGRRLVALYGHPGDRRLGSLGEQGVDAAVERARQLAAAYDGHDGAVAVPTFEIITTVASAEPGADGDYSLESTIDHIRPWVDAAASSGVYVVLDLQPGHADFLSQARRYEELLARPHVGLALDPEWRLAPGERHMQDIGQVGAEEVNRVAAWLAELTRRHALPQKLLLLHQFRLDMLPDREAILTHPELALVVQMDGLGNQPTKLDTWAAITRGGPDGVRFGWKHFYDEDAPVRPPDATVSLEPSPVFVSYQ